MPNHYTTVVFTPSTWQAFKALPKKALGFRLTHRATLNKLKNGDVLICYLAKQMVWCGVLIVSGEPYESTEHVFATQHGMPLILDVDPVCTLDQQQVPVKAKELWGRLERFKHEDHRVNGWAVKVGLLRSLRKLSLKDAETLQIFLANAQNNSQNVLKLQQPSVP